MHPAIPSNDALRKAVKDYLAHGEESKACTTYGPIADWDVSRITDMSNLFNRSIELVNTGAVRAFTFDLSRWDVGKVTNMRCMFWGATAFTSDLSKWDVGKVTDMRCMFLGAEAFTPSLVPLPNGRGWTAESLAKHRAHWRWVRLRALYRIVRPIVTYWDEQAGKTAYAEGGTGRKRDRAAFEAEFGGVSTIA